MLRPHIVTCSSSCSGSSESRACTAAGLWGRARGIRSEGSRRFGRRGWLSSWWRSGQWLCASSYRRRGVSSGTRRVAIASWGWREWGRSKGRGRRRRDRIRRGDGCSCLKALCSIRLDGRWLDGDEGRWCLRDTLGCLEGALGHGRRRLGKGLTRCWWWSWQWLS